MSTTWTAIVEVKGSNPLSNSHYPTQIIVPNNPGGYPAIKRLLEAQYGVGRVSALYPNND